MASELIHMPLSPMDYVPGINYVTTVFYLGMKPRTKLAEVFGILQEGLHKLFLQLPWLSGKTHRQSPDTPGWRPGRLEIRYTPIAEDGPRPSQIRSKRLETAESFDSLRAAGFPLSAFEDREILWKPMLPDITDGTEVLIAQANFIPGGCVLAFGMLHSTTDLAGSAMVLQLWADHCRSISSRLPAPILEDESSSRTILDSIWRKEAKLRPVTSLGPEIWHMVGLEPPGPDMSQPTPAAALPAPMAGIMKSRMFYISPASYKTLRKECQEAGITDVSGNDILCALIWRILMKARTAAEGGTDPDELVQMVVTVDGRHHFSQTMSLPQSYLGNVVLHHRPTLAVRTLTAGETTIPSIARAIRDSARGISHQSTMEAYSLLRDCPDYGLVRRMHPRRLLFSSLIMVSDDINFGASELFTNSGRPEGYRPMPSIDDSLGLPVCFIMPRKKSGGIEFMANLYEEELAFLLEDEEFQRYVYLLT